MKFSHFSGYFLLAVTVVLSAGCGQSSEKERKTTAVPVRLATLELQNVEHVIQTSGRLLPASTVKLAFTVGGIVESVFVNEGEGVRKGQRLARLKMDEIQARFIQAEKAFTKAQRDLARVRNLYEDKAATLEQLQNATTAYEVAKAGLEIARFNRRYAVITSPVSGSVLKRLVEKNEMVAPGSPVFVVGSTAERWVVRAGVSERDILLVEEGNRASVYFEAYPDLPFAARISKIPAAVDPASGTFEVELELDRRGHKLLSGFVARVEIVTAKRDRVALVPVAALVDAEGSRGALFAIDEGVARRVEVRIHSLRKNQVAVHPDGLETIRRVVIAGASYLHDGARVRIIPEEGKTQ